MICYTLGLFRGLVSLRGQPGVFVFQGYLSPGVNVVRGECHQGLLSPRVNVTRGDWSGVIVAGVFVPGMNVAKPPIEQLKLPKILIKLHRIIHLPHI